MNVRTRSGRLIPVPPQAVVGRLLSTNVAEIKQHPWMIEQAIAEARFRRDAPSAARFGDLQPGALSSADAGLLCLYLFGQVFPVFDAETGELLKPGSGQPVQRGGGTIKSRL